MIGAAFVTGQRRLVRPAVIAFAVLCLADWVLIEDFGFFGGLGTDPNSMIPFALLAVSGYLALTPRPADARRNQPARQAGRGRLAGADPAGRRCAGRWPPRASGRSPSAGALGLIILGAAPMAAAQASPNADPILAEAIAGSTRAAELPGQGLPAHRPARPDGEPGQPARQGGPAHLPGPGLHQRLPADRPGIPRRQASSSAPAPRKVELVAVVANPVYHQVAYTQAFDRQEHLTQVPNWLYLTGSVPQLQQVWKDYGIAAQILPAGSMIGHPDIAYVIDQAGQVRAGTEHRPRPGHHRHQILVRRPARRRRPARAEVLMNRPALLASAAAGRDDAGGRVRQRGQPRPRPGQPRPHRRPWPPRWPPRPGPGRSR